MQSLALDHPPVNPSSPRIPASPYRPKFPGHPSSEPSPMDPDSRTAQISGHPPPHDLMLQARPYGPRNQACPPTLAPGLLLWPMHQSSPCGSRHQANLGGLWHQTGPHRLRTRLIPMYPRLHAGPYRLSHQAYPNTRPTHSLMQAPGKPIQELQH